MSSVLRAEPIVNKCFLYLQHTSEASTQLEHILLECDVDLATVKALLDAVRNVAYYVTEGIRLPITRGEGNAFLIYEVLLLKSVELFTLSTKIPIQIVSLFTLFLGQFCWKTIVKKCIKLVLHKRGYF